MTPAERGDLAERMVYKAARLAAVVHGDGGAWDVDNLIGTLDRTELLGLAVVLAAMVDPDATVDAVLSHVTWDEELRPVTGQVYSGTIRQLANVRRLVTA